MKMSRTRDRGKAEMRRKTKLQSIEQHTIRNDYKHDSETYMQNAKIQQSDVLLQFLPFPQPTLNM